MRFSPCLLLAGLSTGVHAFYPWELKVETGLLRRFMPWTLLPSTEDDISAKKPLTFDIKKASVRRDTYSIVEANTPTLPNSAPLDQDGMDYSYFAVVQVGSQKEEMWLALDTGSPSSWVFGTSCTDSVCTSHHTWNKSESSSYYSNSSSYSIGYGSGDVKMDLGQDIWSVADMDVTFTFGSAFSVNESFTNYPIDGILGLGRSHADGWTIPSFMDVVASKALLGSNVVGFSLSRAADDPKDGEVNFGTIDTTKFDGNISYTATNQDTWTIPLDDVYVNDQAVNLTGKSATIDTGTTYILIPPADAASLFALIPGSSPSGENYIIPCNSTATLEFEFSGIKYSIQPEDYIGASSTGGCVSTIVGHDSFGNNTWLVGDVFLKNVYTVFDFDNVQVGFGGRLVNSTSVNGTFSSSNTTAAVTEGSTSAATASGSASTTAVATGSASHLSLGVGSSLLMTVLSVLFLRA
ncbi:Sphingolipid delta4-desaturase N-terminal [Penicillium atrosanguineum]|uniref:penicillopepsin n=1 Tax=Penicillium atrosanguineum TaxID=1132637 RepID=A0A9W9Q8L0_9EURO|nr:Sphingolipid delta4-desaturase N-terminal [Penicillium atrosanguineum]KAJ5304798.1 Sphingolipid delta4-desaturase N-terminal [Penicillium atrosanguineum]KAJ5324261.1 Aspartic-type endopeptidase ctsD [Penicillium atrosanguineum]